MQVPSPEATDDPGLLKIGEAAALTGVSAGRIRHYQRLGLVRPSRGLTGYRLFTASDLLRLLQIDLLRGVGLGLPQISLSLPGHGDTASLHEALLRHRGALDGERQRLETLIAAVDRALAAPAADPAAVAAILSSAHSRPRQSLGVFGRLTKPLSETAWTAYQGALSWGADLPVPPIFGRMLLPAQVTDLLEQLAAAEGFDQLFRRLAELARDIVVRSELLSDQPGAARELGRGWMDQLERRPLPADVRQALARNIPRIRNLRVLNQGFRLWAATLSPFAAAVLEEIDAESRRRGLLVLAVLPSQRRPTRSARQRALARR